ncbi:MarR family winged helix-turn-helix transcriptional regulator [Pseudooceanicola sp. C21-150M6]|uniref:MarR family winged helix-turn-helix transcriptional regulator n=1 Tax=Pseudooceanicola sp. C21-150M6 TaxID=3434355 RepID=UPI003D7F8738
MWLRMLKSTRRVESQLRERLRKEFATTLPRFDVMAALARYEDGLNMSTLSDMLRVSNGNVTGIVDRLVQEGLVIRVQDQRDRRSMRVRLTGNGRTAFAAQAPAHETWIDELLADFTPAEALAFAEQFDVVAKEYREKSR